MQLKIIHGDWHTKPVTIKDKTFISKYTHKKIPTWQSQLRKLNKTI